MTFKEYWLEVAKAGVLPMEALQHIPEALSKKTKKKLMRLEPGKTAKILSEAIDILASDEFCR